MVVEAVEPADDGLDQQRWTVRGVRRERGLEEGGSGCPARGRTRETGEERWARRPWAGGGREVATLPWPDEDGPRSVPLEQQIHAP